MPSTAKGETAPGRSLRTADGSRPIGEAAGLWPWRQPRSTTGAGMWRQSIPLWTFAWVDLDQRSVREQQHRCHGPVLSLAFETDRSIGRQPSAVGELRSE